MFPMYFSGASPQRCMNRCFAVSATGIYSISRMLTSRRWRSRPVCTKMTNTESLRKSTRFRGRCLLCFQIQQRNSLNPIPINTKPDLNILKQRQTGAFYPLKIFGVYLKTARCPHHIVPFLCIYQLFRGYDPVIYNQSQIISSFFRHYPV